MPDIEAMSIAEICRELAGYQVEQTEGHRERRKALWARIDMLLATDGLLRPIPGAG